MGRPFVTATMHFLKPNPLFSKQKPYAFNYGLETAEIPRTNMEREPVADIRIRDLRGSEDDYNLEKHGFEVMQLQSELSRDDFFDKSKLCIYFNEVDSLLKLLLNAKQVKVIRQGIC